MLDLLEFQSRRVLNVISAGAGRPPSIEIDQRKGARVNKNDLAIRREGYHCRSEPCSSRDARTPSPIRSHLEAEKAVP